MFDNGYYQDGNYYFYVRDHLGNNRLVTDAAAAVVQSNHYYPFGMSFAESTAGEKQPYKYNNKELDDRAGLNWYDYSARMKDDWGFTTMDPHSENYYSWSPYVYVGNNPMRFIDPTGMDWFVNNETGDVIFINGVDKITEDHREEYSLGTANYEHLGADNMFGDNVTWFGNYENILDSDFTLIGKTSEVFMQTKGDEKAERVVVETTSTSIMQIEGNGKKFAKGVNAEVKEINKTYVHPNRFGEYKELGERTMQLGPDVDEFVSSHQLIRRPGEQILPKDVGRSIDVIGALNEMKKHIKGWMYQKSQAK